LVAGEGDLDNKDFILSADGQLSTARVFDYEEQTQLSIRVRVSAHTGDYLDRVFVVEIWDQVAPMVETDLPQPLEDGRVWLGGVVTDTSGSSEWEVGLYQSDRPFYYPDESGVEKVVLSTGELSFGYEYMPPAETKKIYVMAYVENAEGVHYGLVEEFDYQNREDSALANDTDIWTGAKAYPGMPGWWESPWLGAYFKDANGWWFIADLGWVYPSGGHQGGIWLWKEGLNWVWTRRGLYPFLYSFDDGAWYYFYGELNQRRMLYNYQSGLWQYLDDRGVDETVGEGMK
jgi:hypothetical protein